MLSCPSDAAPRVAIAFPEHPTHGQGRDVRRQILQRRCVLPHLIAFSLPPALLQLPLQNELLSSYPPATFRLPPSGKNHLLYDGMNVIGRSAVNAGVKRSARA